MDLAFFAISIFVIAGLLALRIIMRRTLTRDWKTVFETNSRVSEIANDIRRKLDESNVRSRIVYKGPGNSPVIGMSGEQIVAIEVHVEDLHIARPIVSRMLNGHWKSKR